MKRTIKLAVAAAVALTSTTAFATNGDSLIAVGAKARGMGGAGIGMSHGAESALANPALISSVKGTEISFGGTVFMPDVETNMGTGGNSIKSKADLSVIPEVAVAQKVSDNFSWGIGMYGVAGMGTDYRDKLDNFNEAGTVAAANAAGTAAGTAAFTATFNGTNMDAAMAAAMAAGGMAAEGTVMGALAQGNFAMVTNLQLMQFAVPLTYKESGFSIGIAPVLQYGSLDINYNLASPTVNSSNQITAIDLTSSSTRGVAQDFGFGYTAGLAYEMDGFTIGASYKSKIDMVYKGQLSKAIGDFTQGTMTLSDHLEQPAEMGVGTSYSMGGHTFALDYKQIKWASAQGYKDFGWEDQNVYAIGYQYAQDDFALRAGYNHAKSAVQSVANPVMNTLNLLGFPATVESHYTVGGTYAFNKTTSLDLAYVYAAAKTDTYANMLRSTTTTKHSQDAASFQLNFNF